MVHREAESPAVRAFRFAAASRHISADSLDFAEAVKDAIPLSLAIEAIWKVLMAVVRIETT